jgi:hypothetical protein
MLLVCNTQQKLAISLIFLLIYTFNLWNRCMSSFWEKVRQLQWDDHRYYHQCRINQTLHLVSAVSFLVAYGLLFVDPASAGLLGWMVGMVARQSGHLFFEPRGYDHRNEATYQHKEDIKVGFNMRRKAVLIGVWLLLPVLLLVWQLRQGLQPMGADVTAYLHALGLLWLSLGVAGWLFRIVHLFVLRSPAWGLAWACKIVLDPLHNVHIYWHSPLALLRGERMDPLHSLH